ncbi:Uncharacterized protein APZ42_000992 [Daphnia magna]|uniref:Uncharacterized protein n=1 Tax=Daphnia magna TaxID=35525 RepID=A0A164J8Q4_9CRUS|nr:Uncharacterized protein APZ42_000992 [Daphnia magna]
MISGGVQENLIDLFHGSENGIAEMVCSNLERVKVRKPEIDSTILSFTGRHPSTKPWVIDDIKMC